MITCHEDVGSGHCGKQAIAIVYRDNGLTLGMCEKHLRIKPGLKDFDILLVDLRSLEQVKPKMRRAVTIPLGHMSGGLAVELVFLDPGQSKIHVRLHRGRADDRGVVVPISLEFAEMIHELANDAELDTA